ncbi:methyltransferase domain-containing protein [Aurantiacibacter sediminis]|uniref:Methyltransferase domain-containing protein n=1 Tax=Aurantiacibacter sediminis TaxID=2793064 RepID=A0ABS0N2K0_9SPHN|nr:methyltransferase domain-containing protein [Aurantiacibacter sediminis]MBH5321239.1 methyltransferase domain-containing protein [Aurantiacibacter sediminis]
MAGTLEEHYEYLSTERRHELYAQAIAKALAPGDTVADLGCGFGVLGFQCLEAGAAQVHGLDRTDAIEIARETARREGLSDRYHCIRGSSFRTELDEKVELIICDHVGFFGIDYGIIAMLGDARRRMLKPGGTVMPRRIDLQIAGVRSDKCAKLTKAWSTAPVPSEYVWLDGYAANSKHRVELAADELCSAVAALGSVSLDSDCPDVLRFKSEVTIEEGGVLHGIAGWFDCELAEGVWMTNSPVEDRAIARSQAFFPLGKPMDVEAGERLSVSFRIDHEHQVLSWTVARQDGRNAQPMSTWCSTIVSPSDLSGQSGTPLRANDLGRARKALLDLIDGHRSAQDIEAALLAMKPPLFPSEDEVKRFLTHELKSVSE